MKKLILVAVAALAVTACTDAQRSKFGAYGSAARVTCYSGGKVVFDDFSTGKVTTEGAGDTNFRSATTGKLIEMAGDCRVIYDAVKPVDFQPVGVN
jgi:hypothetical protein